MDLPQRKYIRLKNFDYASENYYFVTICTYNKQKIFGMDNHLTELGRIAEKRLSALPSYYDGIRVDQFVIMPNHIHFILIIGCDPTARKNACPTLGSIVGSYKAGVSREIHRFYPDMQVWQTRFWDRVIRSSSAYAEACKYIEENPLKWNLPEGEDY